jgi:excisionase family DNA binding protein
MTERRINTEPETPATVAFQPAASSPWLTVATAADYAGLSRDTVYTACERGELRHVKVGGRRVIRLKAEWVDEWLLRHQRGVSTAGAGPP